jgi:uncharacterized membrane protein YkvA (DUF1232 family)
MNNQFPDFIKRAGSIIIIAASLAYIFWSNDIIPDKLTALNPQVLLGFIDDAVIFIGMIFTLKKWRSNVKTRGEKINWLLFLAYLPVIAFVIWYMLTGVDIIPDKAPFLVGYIDDVIAIFAGIKLTGYIRQFIAPKKRK